MKQVYRIMEKNIWDNHLRRKTDKGLRKKQAKNKLDRIFNVYEQTTNKLHIGQTL